jgi:hypothetical protein
VWHQAGWRSAAAPAGLKSRPLETDASGLNRSFKDEDRGDAGIEGEHCAARKAGLAFSQRSYRRFQPRQPSGLSTRQRDRARTDAQTGGTLCTFIVRQERTGHPPSWQPICIDAWNWNSRKPLFICMHVGIACRMWMPSTAPAGRTRLDRNDGSARLVFLLKTAC